jgi:hypothetical protein
LCGVHTDNNILTFPDPEQLKETCVVITGKGLPTRPGSHGPSANAGVANHSKPDDTAGPVSIPSTPKDSRPVTSTPRSGKTSSSTQNKRDSSSSQKKRERHANPIKGTKACDNNMLAISNSD